MSNATASFQGTRGSGLSWVQILLRSSEAERATRSAAQRAHHRKTRRRSTPEERILDPGWSNPIPRAGRNQWAAAHAQLRGGQVALCAVSGLLNGIFGSGEDQHVATWQVVNVVDRSEETEEDRTIVARERKRFTNELTIVYASGETAVLQWHMRP